MRLKKPYLIKFLMHLYVAVLQTVHHIQQHFKSNTYSDGRARAHASRTIFIVCQNTRCKQTNVLIKHVI